MTAVGAETLSLPYVLGYLSAAPGTELHGFATGCTTATATWPLCSKVCAMTADTASSANVTTPLTWPLQNWAVA